MTELRVNVEQEETEQPVEIERENTVINKIISPVQSVNNKTPDATGNIEINNEDVGAPSTEDFSALEETVRGKQDELTAGDNITIVNNVISAAGKAYTAGNGLTLEGTEFSADTTVLATKNDLSAKQDALNQAQLDAVNSGIDATKVGQIATNASDISAVEGKIPAQASSSNQLADKGFVNSSIQTQTAHFRGNWENWNTVPTDASEYPVDDDGNHEPTSNDYMVVQDASGFPVGSGEPALEGTWRFKYSGTWTTNGKNGWLPEYQVNETPLTSAQLAALNSGITDTAVTKLNGIEAGAEVNDIDSISVNGTAVTPDANKNVDLAIPDGIKTLTTDDYNWPTTGTKTGVASWLLEPGAYVVGENTVVYRPKTSAGSSFVTINAGWPIFVTEKATVFGAYGSLSVFDSGSGNGPYLTTFVSIDQTGVGHIAFLGLAKSSFVGNNWSYVPMSISLGNQLNTAIQNKADKTAFTGTDGTAAGTAGLVPAPATTDAGKVLSASGSWTTPDAGIETLTTADYNYPTSNPDGVALWLLDAGFYCIATNVKVYTSTSNNFTTGATVAMIVTKQASNRTRILLTRTGSSQAWEVFFTNSAGTATATGTGYIITASEVVDYLTDTSTNLPLSANQGKVLKDLIDSLVIKNAGAPTTSTAGTVGMLLEDTTNGKLYQCTAIDNTDPQAIVYTWTEVGGGSGPTVVQTTGTSTTDVMSQNAVTTELNSRARAATVNYGGLIIGGNNIGSAANYGTVINPLLSGTSVYGRAGDTGFSACGGKASGEHTITFSGGSKIITGKNCVNFNDRVNTNHPCDVDGVVDLHARGSTGAAVGYNSSIYCLLTGVYDPQSAHDAATKGYVDNAVINGGTTAPTNSTAGAVGTQYTYVDTTGTPTAHLCVCTEVDTTDPDNPVYAWQTLI